MIARRLEVHEHAIIRGSRAHQSWRNRIVHSHEGGDVPHAHDDTGPACYTIDKDEWAARTGLRGGGRKKFTRAPIGEQLEIRDLEDWQRSFDVIVADPLPAGDTALVEQVATRMTLAFGMKPQVHR